MFSILDHQNRSIRILICLIIPLLWSGCSPTTDLAAASPTSPATLSPPTQTPNPPTGTPAGATTTPLLPTITPLPPTQTTQPTATPLPTLSGRGGGVIAYAKEIDTRRHIYLINADGSDGQQLTTSGSWDNWPSWSPDGTQLAFTCRESIPGLGGGICVINIDGSDRQQLSGSDDWEPAWSPDGKWIAFASLRDGNPEIYVMQADGTNERRLTHDPEDDWQPNWSPDGTHLAFTSGRDGDWEIYVMDISDPMTADDSALQKLTDNEIQDSFAAWSPDGTQISFASMRDGDDEIFLMTAPQGPDIDQEEPVQLTHNDIKNSFPRWSPDGTRIVYTAFVSRNAIFSFDLYIMKADGSGQRQLTRDHLTEEACPSWQP